MAAGQRILIVEDSLLLADALCGFAIDCGLQPVGPANGLEAALAYARDLDLDAAILDSNLSGRLSFPVCEALEHRGIPFCFVTGYSHLGLIPEQYRAVPVVAKPFEPQLLQGVIDMMLNGKSTRSLQPTATSAERRRASS